MSVGLYIFIAMVCFVVLLTLIGLIAVATVIRGIGGGGVDICL